MIRLGVIGYGHRISDVIGSCLRKVEPDLKVVGIIGHDEKGARSRLRKCDQKEIRFYKDIEEGRYINVRQVGKAIPLGLGE